MPQYFIAPPPPPSDATAETFVPLVDSVTDIALLETMPDIDQALLQFIDVMNLLDRLLHFSHNFAVNRVQIYAIGWQKVW